MTCAVSNILSVGQLLSDCTSLQQFSVNDKSTLPNMQSTHTHILLFGSKFIYFSIVCANAQYIHTKIKNIQKIGKISKISKKSDIFDIF